ncbi:MAG: Uma2 family endonuclease [Tepidiformaceae bacterium]
MTARPRATETWEHSRYDGQRMSEAAYLALPEEKPYLEYVDGVVVQKAMPDSNHSRIVAELALLIGLFAREHGGWPGVEKRSHLLNRGNYRLADVEYTTAGAPAGDDALPTLAIEVRSPDETVASQRRKCEGWIEAGVREAWLVEPRTRTVEVFAADGARETLAEQDVLVSKAVPGLEVDLAGLFGVLDR